MPAAKFLRLIILLSIMHSCAAKHFILFTYSYAKHLTVEVKSML